MCRAVNEAKGGFVAVTPADVTLACSPSCIPALGNTVAVTVQGRFTLLTPLLAVFTGGQTESAPAPASGRSGCSRPVGRHGRSASTSSTPSGSRCPRTATAATRSTSTRRTGTSRPAWATSPGRTTAPAISTHTGSPRSSPVTWSSPRRSSSASTSASTTTATTRPCIRTSTLIWPARTYRSRSSITAATSRAGPHSMSRRRPVGAASTSRVTS